MTRRSVATLAVVALLLIAAVVALQMSERPMTGDGDDAPLFPELEAELNAVDTVIVTAAGNETVATLERGERGWTVAERDGYPADTAKLRRLLIALGEARRIERKTADPALHSRLGVEDLDAEDAGGLGVELRANGNPRKVILGDTARGDSRYARIAGEAQSWLIDVAPDVPQETGEWLVPEIVDLDSDELQSVTISHPDGETIRIARGGGDAEDDPAEFRAMNLPEGRELRYATIVNSVASALEGLTLDDVRRAPEAPSAQAVVTEYVTADGLVVTVETRGEDEERWHGFNAAVSETAEQPSAKPSVADAGADAADANTDADETGSSSDDSAGPAGGEEAAPETPAEAARRINARVNGWEYSLPSFKADQLERRWEDLLQAEESEE